MACGETQGYEYQHQCRVYTYIQKYFSVVNVIYGATITYYFNVLSNSFQNTFVQGSYIDRVTHAGQTLS